MTLQLFSGQQQQHSPSSCVHHRILHQPSLSKEHRLCYGALVRWAQSNFSFVYFLRPGVVSSSRSLFTQPDYHLILGALVRGYSKVLVGCGLPDLVIQSSVAVSFSWSIAFSASSQELRKAMTLQNVFILLVFSNLQLIRYERVKQLPFQHLEQDDK